MTQTNNPPDKIVELTAEQHEFLIRNCDSNLAFALANLQTVTRPTAEKLVEQMEMFKGIKKALNRAK